MENMKIIFVLIVLGASIVFFPQLLAAIVVGAPIFLFYKVRGAKRKKMTEAEKRKAFSDDIFYY